MFGGMAYAYFQPWLSVRYSRSVVLVVKHATMLPIKVMSILLLIIN